jgi:hypothetical protein
MEGNMARYLVVANETVTNPLLLEQLTQITAEDQEAEFTLLVPATPDQQLLLLRDSGQESAVVAALAGKARKMFEMQHINIVDTHVGSGSPAEAIDNEVEAHPGYAGFVISTFPQEDSRWLRMGLPKLVQSKYGLPVRYVQAPPDWSGILP